MPILRRRIREALQITQLRTKTVSTMASAFSTARDSSPKSARRGSFTATTLARRTTSSHSKPSGRTRQIAAFLSVPASQHGYGMAATDDDAIDALPHADAVSKFGTGPRRHHRDAGATSNALTGDRFRPAAPPAVIHTHYQQ